MSPGHPDVELVQGAVLLYPEDETTEVISVRIKFRRGKVRDILHCHVDGMWLWNLCVTKNQKSDRFRIN